MNYKDLTTIEPDNQSGKPRIHGTRMDGQDVLEYLAVGGTEAELEKSFDFKLSFFYIRYIN